MKKILKRLDFEATIDLKLMMIIPVPILSINVIQKKTSIALTWLGGWLVFIYDYEDYN